MQVYENKWLTNNVKQLTDNFRKELHSNCEPFSKNGQAKFVLQVSGN